MQIDGTEVHTIVPQGNARFIGLDDYQTKKFCTEGKHSFWDSLIQKTANFHIDLPDMRRLLQSSQKLLRSRAANDQ